MIRSLFYKLTLPPAGSTQVENCCGPNELVCGSGGTLTATWSYRCERHQDTQARIAKLLLPECTFRVSGTTNNADSQLVLKSLIKTEEDIEEDMEVEKEQEMRVMSPQFGLNGGIGSLIVTGLERNCKSKMHCEGEVLRHPEEEGAHLNYPWEVSLQRAGEESKRERIETMEIGRTLSEDVRIFTACSSNNSLSNSYSDHDMLILSTIYTS